MLDFYDASRTEQFRRLRRLAEVALERYQLDKVTVAPLMHSVNTTFRVTRVRDRARFLLRVHTVRRLADEIRSELLWLDALARDGFTVPEPIRARHGERLVKVSAPHVPEARNCSLLTWVEGRHVRKQRNPELLRGIGTAIARLHTQAERLDVPPQFTRPRWDASTLEQGSAWSAGWERLTRVQRDIFHEVARRFKTLARQLGSGRDVFGLIHGDFTFDNVVVARGEVRVIDFDDCGFGYFLYDIATLLDRIEWRSDYKELRAALISGYREQRELAPDHEALLTLFLLVRWVFLGLAFLSAPEHSPERAYSQRFLRIVVPKMRKYLRKM